MIDLYTWTTPNGRKASILLEELGLPYTVHPIDITKDEQFHPDFLKISPNNRIPAIVDRDTGFHLMESGAIMLYLVEKTGKLLPHDLESRYRVIEWLMWQMGGIGRHRWLKAVCRLGAAIDRGCEAAPSLRPRSLSGRGAVIRGDQGMGISWIFLGT